MRVKRVFLIDFFESTDDSKYYKLKMKQTTIRMDDRYMI